MKRNDLEQLHLGRLLIRHVYTTKVLLMLNTIYVNENHLLCDFFLVHIRRPFLDTVYQYVVVVVSLSGAGIVVQQL